MKNYNFYISLYIIIAAALSRCAVTKKQAPIEYHHSNSNLEDSRSVNENTVSIISSKSNLTLNINLENDFSLLFADLYFGIVIAYMNDCILYFKSEF